MPSARWRKLRIAPLFEGVRGEPPMDVDALVDAMVRIDELMADTSARVMSIDLNPVMLNTDGCVVVDAVVFKGSNKSAVMAGLVPAIHVLAVPLALPIARTGPVHDGRSEGFDRQVAGGPVRSPRTECRGQFRKAFTRRQDRQTGRHQTD